MTRLRVAYLDHSAAMSGAEIALLRLVRANSDTDTVVLLAEDGPLVAELRATGVRVIVAPLPAAARVRRTAVGPRLPIRAVVTALRHTIHTARLLRALRPDVVHTNSMKAHLYGGVAARLLDIPHVWHARDRAAADYLPPAAVRFVRAAARHLPTIVIANSRATLATYPGVQTGVVVHDAVPPHVRRTPRSEAPLRIGVVGRLAPWKGQDVFIDAFAAAFGGGDERAVLIGDALFGEHDFVAALRRRTVELGIEDRVKFAGYVDDVPARLDDLHVLVHCSTTPEPFGQVVVEGMAAGLPVIASDAGGPREVVDDGRTGLLVTPGDVDGLRDAMVALAGDPALRDDLGRAAAREAATRFTPARVAAQVGAVHRAAAGRDRGAPVSLDTTRRRDVLDVRTAPVSVVICTKDEEALIERVIHSAGFADEVLVCDSGSSDRTRELARATGARVVEQEWLGFSRQKNHAAALARHDWILSLDADEIVTSAMAADIVDRLTNDPDPATGWAVDRRGVFFGAALPNQERRRTRDRCVRLYNRTLGGWDEGMEIHEVVRVPGTVRLLDGHLLHRRDLSMDDFFRVFNRNATAEAAALPTRPSSRIALDVLVHPILRFLWCYLVKGEVRLGQRGLVHSCVAAGSDLMRHAKAWEQAQRLSPPRGATTGRRPEHIDVA